MGDPSTDIVAESRDRRLALTRRQQAFVEAYARPGTRHGEPCLSAAEAVRVAGYSHKRADNTAVKLLRQPKVKAAVDALRAEVAEQASYTAAKAMAELEAGMELAKATDNASAYVRAVELRAKLTGILIDRVDARVAVGTFSLVVQRMETERAGG